MNGQQPKALATSGVRWGLSCEVADEASMGVLLGYMKLFGATAIGFDPLAPVGEQKRRSPVARAAPGKGKKLGRPKGRASHSRKPLMVEAREVIAKYPAGHEFGAQDFHLSMKRWSLSARSRALMLLVKEKAIKRVKLGVYRAQRHLTIVKPEKAA